MFASLFHSSGSRQSRSGWSAGLLQEVPIPDANILGSYPHPHQLGWSSSLRVHPPCSRTEEEAQRRSCFSLLGNILEVAQIASLPMLQGELVHTPSVAAEEAGNSVILGPSVSQVFSCSEREVDKAIASHLDISATPLLMLPPTIQPLLP